MQGCHAARSCTLLVLKQNVCRHGCLAALELRGTLNQCLMCGSLQAPPTKPSPAPAVPSKQTKLLDSSVASELQAKRVAAQRRGKPLARWVGCRELNNARP